jgi:hypothetical protein
VAGDAPSSGLLPTCETEFAVWVHGQLENAPGREKHAKVFEEAEASIVKWRQRYNGAQGGALWKRRMKPRVFKEIIESAPVMSAVRDFVDAYDETASGKLTIIDLYSGKGFLSMLL